MFSWVMGGCDVLCMCRIWAVQGTRKVCCGLSLLAVNCSEILCGVWWRSARYLYKVQFGAFFFSFFLSFQKKTLLPFLTECQGFLACGI